MNKVLLLLMVVLTGCSPAYLVEAAWHEGNILLNRRKVTEVLALGTLNRAESQALTYVQEAREFALKRGLSVGDAFTTYSPIDRDVLVWVVMGCKPDSFSIKQWWFPIVGSVPYKGFFRQADAESAATILQNEGYETFVRGAGAFSTLGWFNDPILTPLLHHPPTFVVNTVLHELVHSTVWIQDDASFNESLANFIGLAETVRFFRENQPNNEVLLADATQELEQELALSRLSETVYQKLSTIYNAPLSKEDKLTQKQLTFAKAHDDAHAIGLNTELYHRANNAEFLQVFLYVRRLDLFDRLYRHDGANLKTFLSHIHDFQGILKLHARNPADSFIRFERFVNDVVEAAR